MCNFRVKVDLSAFYDDVRRFSWVYVDKGTVTCICHLQNHIAKVFDIQQPLHLLLHTGEYLPPNEDARILKENETIVAVPGTGLQNDQDSGKAESDVQVDTSSIISSSKKHKQPPAEEKNEKGSIANGNDFHNSTETTNGNTLFLSVVNDSQIESASESKMEVGTLDENLVQGSPPFKNKRKRTRQRKSKTKEQPEEPVAAELVESEYKKPKIINSVTIPNGKHIRFGDVEQQEFDSYDSSASCDSRKPSTRETTPRSKSVPNSSLSNLLALRQSSTPITFAAQKKLEKNQQPQHDSYEVKELSTEDCQTPTRFTEVKVDPEKHVLMESKARVNDIIGFKMLKMGQDYTPQVSKYVTAQVSQILPDNSTYVFEIIDGKREIQAPQGKFDIETDETENKDSNAFVLNWSQLIEPRLMYRGSSE
ncbi:uncharacterized protein LOC124176315 [Neodiprion fabricii]|uniref:uncharacterized protein LOC124176315 n=1 Tax=Neodiprion fabricii TaxID=2872261 RepID=UPI001ED91B9B|nr:uncharacterized protein LOC124176315 [Neodiprion fabricii]